ncbi:MAG: flagellar hook assembly protein FlgD [Alphaproteobacteria bacterium]|nr:flagellar hook assembly protein FlgD [Alphaproteobacteria bacterium]
METDLIASGGTVNTGGLNAATSSRTSANASQTQLSSDINFFLKMLTTQLKNQDPSAPMDTNQFTQQIAQYSGVQQQVNTNATLEKLLAASKQSGITTAVGYIGKEIESKGNTGDVIAGQGAFSYVLPKIANSTEVTISDALGRVVFRGNGDTKEGRNLVIWDGINSETGAQEPDGTYTIAINALDTQNKPLLAEPRSVGIVSGVENDSAGNTLLQAGNRTVKFEDVLAVRAISRANI